MKLRKEMLICTICVLILGLIVFICYKYLNQNSNTKSSDNTSKEENKQTINNGELELNLNSSYAITEGGTYKLTGNISNGLITVNTIDDVKIILNGINITNNSGPCINIENAKSVTIELSEETTNTLTDGSNYSNVDIDSCIYSKDDLIIQGEGTLIVNASYKEGITSKDKLTIKSGIINIKASDDAIKGKDSVTIDGGNITIDSQGDAIKSTNEEDKSKGNITVNDGTLTIKSVKDGFDSVNKVIINNGTIKIDSNDDGIHADGYIEINNGDITISAVEGLEATYIKINDGNINISASDDGINCANKSDDYKVLCEFNGGNITIKMGQGDTDGVDSNGDIIVNGGTIDVTGQSTFDYDGTGTIKGGTVICNGQEVTSLSNQFMGGQGGPGGNPIGGRR